MSHTTVDEPACRFATQPREHLIMAEEAEGNGYSPPASADDETMYAADSTWWDKLSLIHI